MRDKMIFGRGEIKIGKTYVVVPIAMILILCGSRSLLAQVSRGSERAQEVTAERQPVSDLGSGFYRNPVISGDYADNSVVRVGSDYFLVHGSGQPRGMLVWHSRDLVNWEPYCIVPVPVKGSIWAPDLSYTNGLFYLYLPMMHPGTGTVWVMTAKSMKGPWSEPIDLGVHGIDPGAVVDAQGHRYLYVDAGRAVPLTADGLKVDGELTRVYGGWQYPSDWQVECYCLESPKLIHHGDYFYLISAQGGTAGPSTSHMASVARSTSPLGPWENSPYNPLIHTFSRSERWWSQGHGVLIDDVAGNWWMIYHAIENGYRSLGRETLLMQIEWTADGWPRIADQQSSSGILRKPAGENVGAGMPLSDNFESSELGLQWNYRNIADLATSVQVGGGALRLLGGGSDISNAPMLILHPVNHAYEAQVEVEVRDGTASGLGLAAGRDDQFTGGVLRKHELAMYVRGHQQLKLPWGSNHVLFRVRDDHHDISAYYSPDGKQWKRFDFGIELDGEASIRVGLLAAGSGAATFRHFAYQGLN
jgi:xylan 1,4-beta-xylosidase